MAINENIYSCVFLLSYGKFDWFSGGDAFYVYVQDDSDLEYRVKAIFGPYLCK